MRFHGLPMVCLSFGGGGGRNGVGHQRLPGRRLTIKQHSATTVVKRGLIRGWMDSVPCFAFVLIPVCWEHRTSARLVVATLACVGSSYSFLLVPFVNVLSWRGRER